MILSSLKVSLLIAALGLLAFAPIQGQAAEEQNGFLYIGDSISYGKLGQVIDTALRTISENGVTEASCGSSPATWLTLPGQPGHVYVKTVCGFWRKGETEERVKVHNTPKIQEELQNLHPKLTIVQLGTNIAAGSHPLTQEASVREMMQEIRAAGSQCIWIGPPDANSTVVTRDKLQITSEMIQTEASAQGCFYVATLSFTHFPAGPGDGIHPSPQLSAAWAQLILQKMLPTATEALHH